MTDAEFRAWLLEEVEGERMTRTQMDDLLDQKILFMQNFPEGDERPRQPYRLKIVGYVASHMIEAQEIHELLDDAKSRFPGRMIYFEPIGFDLF